MILKVIFLTLCIITNHIESLGQSCPCSELGLGGSYYSCFKSLLAPWGRWIEGDLFGREGVLPASRVGRASGSHGLSSVYTCSLFHDGYEYNSWGLGIPFIDEVTNKLDYEEFSGTCLMPSLTVPVCVFAPLISFNQSLSIFLYISNTKMKHLCQ